jgi:L-alanine-DL-glutamate epimerase-like enolase superfamily enzyme
MYFVQSARSGTRYFQPENGYMVVPELPGIGIELNDEVVNKSKVFEII